MKVLVAGASGYLGSHIVRELLDREIEVVALVRNARKLLDAGIPREYILEAEATRPNTLEGCCEGIDIVISALGITRQKDGLTYMDVDYQANKNILDEALRSGVQKFIYVSVLNGQHLTHLQICAAKERFVQALQGADLEYCIIRPGGFFSDMGEFFEMAKSGRIYLFGDGTTISNPIDGSDLAKVCVDAIQRTATTVEVGGPELLTQNEIAEIAFAAAGKPVKVTRIPDWVRRILLRLARIFLSKSAYGPAEFFLHVLAMDMKAPTRGQRTLRQYFEHLASKD